MIVYPAIDIYGGKVVRMTRGDFSTVEEVAPSPLEAAKRLVNEGAEWLHIVDIDGARTGEPANLDAIRKVNLVTRGNDAPGTQKEARLNRIYDLGFANGVYFIQAQQL